jgi:hypothetical protein
MKKTYLLFLIVILFSCKGNKNPIVIEDVYGDDVLQSIIAENDSATRFDFVQPFIEKLKLALTQKVPVVLCGDSLNAQQLQAQQIALADTAFTKFTRDSKNNNPYRNEIFAVYPARQSDLANVPANLSSCYKVEMYNYGLNLTSVCIVDVAASKVIRNYTQEQSQPEIPAYLKEIAIKIAINSPEVQQAYGVKPSEKDAIMANTKTALNKTKCERSRHLCVAPTFTKNKDGKALWAIVDLTDYKLVGVRWTNTGNTGPTQAITERKLQDDKITACFCEKETELNKNGWKLNYMLTSSDGLRISQVSFNNNPVLQSAKLVDWHVSYSGTDGFGYSDAVGCPYFSQAAVIAFEPPKVLTIQNDAGQTTGFALEQVFKSELWPQPCNYNYRQRFEFYNDGSFRVAAASIGRGCGNDGTYRPVFRIAFADEQSSFYQYNNNAWQNWQQEQWYLQQANTTYSTEGYLYKIANQANKGYMVQPGTGKFNDGGRGDNAFTYITLNKPNVEEGEADLVTIGPCCNSDYQQGPDKFIGSAPEAIAGKKLVMWYVPQLKNDNTKGNEYCWAESVLQNGNYITKAYPCFAGPKFIPIK